MQTHTSKILRLPEVMAITGLSRSTIYAYMDKGTFPKAMKLGERAIGWLSSDIETWIAERVNMACI